MGMPLNQVYSQDYISASLFCRSLARGSLPIATNKSDFMEAFNYFQGERYSFIF